MIGYDSFERLHSDAESLSLSTAAFVRDLMTRRIRLEPGFDPKDQLRISLLGTFQGGKGSPLHDWYPYLEGYSPDFVNSIIDNFAPTAKTVLDPFCGSGTTALTAALRGIDGLFAEVNPACRFIIQVKARATSMARSDRDRVSSVLEKLASTVKQAVGKAAPDGQLRDSYKASFGDSEFFDKKTFTEILRLRSVADSVLSDDALSGIFFVTAIVRSLVPSSLLIRRGDLRFKTAAELSKRTVPFLEQVCESLRLIASDLHDAPQATGRVRHVCDDARLVGNHLNRQVDAVITSPPYLNGTNYFRNTKIELWFLRQLSQKSGLRVLRDAAITSGINDVTVRKTTLPDMPAASGMLAEVMASLAKDSYDPRIPLMVRSYFAEMGAVVTGIATALNDDGVAAIDLGDSCYGSTWVQTDEILGSMMEAEGFVRVEKVVLRERQSKGGRKLSQTLQVFRRLKIEQRPIKGQRIGKAPARWAMFKNTLPHQTGEMAKRNWGHGLHSLCSYQGKLKPSIANSLVSALLDRPGRVLDPFSGVGTIPFEARLKGSVSFGFDISPAALAISRAKLERADRQGVTKVMKDIKRRIEKARIDDLDLETIDRVRFNGPISEYFHPKTLAEIMVVRDYFLKHPANDGSSALVMASMLHILHGNRPYAVSRRSHPITPFAPTGPTEYRSVFDRLATKVERSLLSLDGTPLPEGKAWFQDASEAWPSEVDDLDAVITSPPFFDSTRFHTGNWMRLWFAGWEAADFRSKPGTFVDERQKKSFDVYRPIFAQCAERLRPGGLVLIHLGKSAKCNMADSLAEIGGSGLEIIDRFDESVAHCESHGIRDKGTVTHHQYVLFRKPKIMV